MESPAFNGRHLLDAGGAGGASGDGGATEVTEATVTVTLPDG